MLAREALLTAAELVCHAARYPHPHSVLHFAASCIPRLLSEMQGWSSAVSTLPQPLMTTSFPLYPPGGQLR